MFSLLILLGPFLSLPHSPSITLPTPLRTTKPLLYFFHILLLLWLTEFKTTTQLVVLLLLIFDLNYDSTGFHWNSSCQNHLTIPAFGTTLLKFSLILLCISSVMYICWESSLQKLLLFFLPDYPLQFSSSKILPSLLSYNDTTTWTTTSPVSPPDDPVTPLSSTLNHSLVTLTTILPVRPGQDGVHPPSFGCTSLPPSTLPSPTNPWEKVDETRQSLNSFSSWLLIPYPLLQPPTLSVELSLVALTWSLHIVLTGRRKFRINSKNQYLETILLWTVVLIHKVPKGRRVDYMYFPPFNLEKRWPLKNYVVKFTKLLVSQWSLLIRMDNSKVERKERKKEGKKGKNERKREKRKREERKGGFLEHLQRINILLTWTLTRFCQV